MGEFYIVVISQEGRMIGTFYFHSHEEQLNNYVMWNALGYMVEMGIINNK